MEGFQVYGSYYSYNTRPCPVKVEYALARSALRNYLKDGIGHVGHLYCRHCQETHVSHGTGST